MFLTNTAPIRARGQVLLEQTGADPVLEAALQRIARHDLLGHRDAAAGVDRADVALDSGRLDAGEPLRDTAGVADYGGSLDTILDDAL